MPINTMMVVYLSRTSGIIPGYQTVAHIRLTRLTLVPSLVANCYTTNLQPSLDDHHSNGCLVIVIISGYRNFNLNMKHGKQV